MLLELLLACKQEPLSCGEQPTFHGDVRLSEDSELQEFMEEYRAVDGDILIEEIDSSYELLGLCRVSGALSITAAMPSYTGLERLEEVGSLNLEDVRSLVGFSGLRQAREISLDVEGLIDLSEFGGLTELEALSVRGDLLSLSGLNNLNRLGSLDISDVALKDLNALSQLDQIDHLWINGGSQTRIDWPALTRVGEARLHGILDVRLDNLEEATDLDIRLSESSLVLPRLRTVGDLTVSSDEIERLDLGELESAQGISLGGVKLDGVVGLEGVGMMDSIALDGPLTAMGPFSSLTELGTMDLRHCARMDLPDLPVLRRIDGLEVYDCPQLQRLTGLRGQKTMARLEVSETGLEDLEELVALGSVTDLLRIRANPFLTSLKGLEGLTEVGRLEIQANPLLPSSEITALIARIGEEHIGNIEVSENGP